MNEDVLRFYNDLAEQYHLLFDDWDAAIDRQAQVLNRLLGQQSKQPLTILDCACGIGTQAIGLAKGGHRVVASDLSPAAVARARREAKRHGVNISFQVSDMTSLAEILESDFDLVAAMDNALPHLSPLEFTKALRAMTAKLTAGGRFIASIRDYDKLLSERPTSQPPAFYLQDKNRRIVHQVWEWLDERRYIVHLYITVQTGDQWRSSHFASQYQAILRDELTSALEGAGYSEVRWIMPEESGYYQPLVLATKH